MVGTAAQIIDVPIEKKSPESILEADLNHNIVLRSLVSDRLPEKVVRMCHKNAIHIYDRIPSVSGRIEMMNYLNEQNFSYNFHRYGNLLGEKS